MFGLPSISSSFTTNVPRYPETTKSSVPITTTATTQSSAGRPSYFPPSPVQIPPGPSKERRDQLPTIDPRSNPKMRDDMLPPYSIPTSNHYTSYLPVKVLHQNTPGYTWSSQQALPLESPALLATTTAAAAAADEQPYSNVQPISSDFPSRYSSSLQNSSYLPGCYQPAGLSSPYFSAHSSSLGSPYQARRSPPPPYLLNNSEYYLPDPSSLYSSSQPVPISPNPPNSNNSCLPSPETLYSSPESTTLSLAPLSAEPEHRSPSAGAGGTAEGTGHGKSEKSKGKGTGRSTRAGTVNSTRQRPQCWEHGCCGREFSTFSNLLRHQRERSGAIAKAECPICGAVFTRSTARNIHVAQGKCKSGSGNGGNSGRGNVRSL